jgi:hypothetical protein
MNASQKGGSSKTVQPDLEWLVNGFADMKFPCLTCNREAFLNDPFTYLIQKDGLRIPVKLSEKKLAANIRLEIIPISEKTDKEEKSAKHHYTVTSGAPSGVQWNNKTTGVLLRAPAGRARAGQDPATPAELAEACQEPEMELLLTCVLPPHTPGDAAPLWLKGRIDPHALDIHVQIVHRGTTQEVKMRQPDGGEGLPMQDFTLSGRLLESINKVTIEGGQGKFQKHLREKIGYVDEPQEADVGGGGAAPSNFMALRGIRLLEQKRGDGINIYFNSIADDYRRRRIRILKLRFNVDIEEESIPDPDAKVQNLIDILLKLTNSTKFALSYHAERRTPTTDTESVETVASLERLRAALVMRADTRLFQELPEEVWDMIGDISGQRVREDAGASGGGDLEPEPQPQPPQ